MTRLWRKRLRFLATVCAIFFVSYCGGPYDPSPLILAGAGLLGLTSAAIGWDL